MNTPSEPPTASKNFRTTHWSLVLNAQSHDEADAAQSLDVLCRQYWPPLYSYVRRCGHSPHDAQDLTQEFFARLLQKHWLNAADRTKGRFRTFLITALKRFMANEWDRARAQRRGGGQLPLSLDLSDAENQWASHDPFVLPAEAIYERQWAITLLNAAVENLQSEFAAAGKLSTFNALKPCLTAQKTNVPYDALATTLQLDPASARSAVHRFRKRFRELFRDQIAATVLHPADIESEFRAVIAALTQA